MSTTDPPREGLGAPQPVPVFRGSQAACLEYALVLEAKGVPYERIESDGAWLLVVAPPLAQAAADELTRYAAERAGRREAPAPFVPFTGSAMGAAVYAFVLILVAYCAGIELFGVDWLRVGALESKAGAAGEWWRAVTALTLHLDQEHLMGNLLFGVVAGMAAGRLLGPGVAWASILGAGVLANYAEILIAPATHRAVGASTAVFAALGLLSGLAWRQRLTLRERRWYVSAALLAGICLLTLLGAGNEHVDVLRPALGVLVGVVVGWFYARAGIPRSRGRRLQIAAGAGAALLVCAAWLAAFSPAGARAPAEGR